MPAPTAAPRAHILRPRLLSPLLRRFELPVVRVVAGAGFGKTCLLEQAIEQNRLSPRGRDLLVTCRPKHRFAESFGRALCAVVDAPEDADPVRAVRDFIWNASPEPVALIVDDVHELQADGSAAELLAELFDALPANGHLVLVGRDGGPLPTERLRAHGAIAELDEARLSFDADEVARFASERGTAHRDLEDASGWPALLELCVVAGGRRAISEYLWDEVLSRLDEERRDALARLARLRSIDDAAVALLTTWTRSAQELVAPLPLCEPVGARAARIHSLWQPALSRLPAANDPETLQAVAQLQRERGEIEEALEILLEIDDDAAIRALLRDLVLRDSRAMGTEALRSILAQLPDAVRRSPYGTLLDGLAGLRNDPERALPQLQRAASQMREAGDRDGEVRALVAQGHVAYYQGDVGKLVELGVFGRELADAGHAGALPLALVAEACGALIRVEPERALQLVDRARSIASIEGVPDFMIAVLASLDAGYPERGIAEAERALGHASPEIRGALEVTQLLARWDCGEAGPDDLDAVRPWLVPDSNETVHNLAVHLAVLTQMAASLGCESEARAFSARCDEYVDRSFSGRAQTALSIGRAALDVLTGDEDAAAETLRRLHAEGALEGRPSRHVLRGISLFTLYVPEARAEIDALALGPAWARGREIGHALVRLREHDDAGPAAALDWARAERIAARLVPPLLTELRVGAMSLDPTLGDDWTDTGSEVRDWLRRITTQGGSSTRRAARGLLAEIPIAPEQPIEIRVLGALELFRGGVRVDDPTWRRARVQSLLLYLLLHPGAHRDEVAAALWPDNDRDSAANNLRVNLHHLIRALQPERRGAERSWFVRQERDRLRIEGGRFLDVDVAAFDAAVAEGSRADADGVPDAALAAFLDAIELYRGDYCLEADELGWGMAERVRLRSLFARAALRAGELLLARGDRDQALSLASRVCKLDPLFEGAYRLQAHSFLQLGDRTSARRALEAALAMLAREGLEPEPETAHQAAALGIPIEGAPSLNPS